MGKKQGAASSNKDIQILFGASGGLLPYQMGIGNFLAESFGKKDLKGICHFGGVSGGAAAAGYLAGVCHGFRDMDHWYWDHARKNYLFIDQNKLRLLGLPRRIWNLANDFYRVCKQPRRQILDGSFHTSITQLPFWRPKIIDRFKSQKDFADTIRATMFIPGLFDIRPWVSCMEHRFCMDGSFTQPFPLHPRKRQDRILWIDVIGISQGVNGNHNLTSINTRKWRAFPWREIVFFKDTKWADRQYEWGYKDAKKNQVVFEKFFGTKIGVPKPRPRFRKTSGVH